MLQLVYISTARAPSIDDELLEAILVASRRNNEAAGLSGLLLVGGRRFLQALEGPDDAVLATYARIKADPRHFAFVELVNKPIDAPEFGSWSMAYAHGTDAHAGLMLRQKVELLTAALPDRDLQAQFTGFAALHSKAA